MKGIRSLVKPDSSREELCCVTCFSNEIFVKFEKNLFESSWTWKKRARETLKRNGETLKYMGGNKHTLKYRGRARETLKYKEEEGRFMGFIV